MLAEMLQGLLAVVAPILPHLAEDAWSHLPWPAQQASVFQVLHAENPLKPIKTPPLSLQL